MTDTAGTISVPQRATLIGAANRKLDLSAKAGSPPGLRAVAPPGSNATQLS